MSNGSKIAVIVLNWNGYKDTLRCLDSLCATPQKNLQIIVCDNASDDASAEKIRAWYKLKCKDVGFRGSSVFSEIQPHHASDVSPTTAPAKVGHSWSNLNFVLIHTGANLGFARGNNVGIRYAIADGADYIFVLNNDTIVDRDCIQRLIEFGELNPEAALMGPRVLDDVTNLYTQWPVATRVSFWSILITLSPLRRIIKGTPLFTRFFYFGDEPKRVYAIPGSAMMFKAATFGKAGLFDENTFLYWEEFIMAEKLIQQGLATYIVPNAIIWHKQSASIAKIGSKKFIENLKSERYFFRRYLKLSFMARAVLNTVRLLAYLTRASVDKSYRENFSEFIRAFAVRFHND